MTINCIKERVLILKKLWNRNHDAHTINVLLSQLNNDIVFFLGEKLPDDLENEIDELEKEVSKYGNHK